MDECFSIRRQCVLYKLAAISFVDKSRLAKTPRVFAQSFLICPDRLNNSLKGYHIVLRDQKQYLNTIMICHSLEMPLHLFCRLHFYHVFILHNIPTFSSLLVCYKNGVIILKQKSIIGPFKLISRHSCFSSWGMAIRLSANHKNKRP